MEEWLYRRATLSTKRMLALTSASRARFCLVSASSSSFLVAFGFALVLRASQISWK